MADPDAFEQPLIRGPGIATLRGARVCLTAWLPADRAPFASINRDPDAMRWFPNPLECAESDALADRLQGQMSRRGWGFWAARDTDKTFIGFIGLGIPGFQASFMPALEIGWRLSPRHWGKGYATEGARLALDYAFTTLGVPEVVAFTATENLPSRRVMARLGMRHNPADDFDHPSLDPASPLCRHVLYRLARTDHA